MVLPQKFVMTTWQIAPPNYSRILEKCFLRCLTNWHLYWLQPVPVGEELGLYCHHNILHNQSLIHCITWIFSLDDSSHLHFLNFSLILVFVFHFSGKEGLFYPKEILLEVWHGSNTIVFNCWTYISLSFWVCVSLYWIQIHFNLGMFMILSRLDFC